MQRCAAITTHRFMQVVGESKWLILCLLLNDGIAFDLNFLINASSFRFIVKSSGASEQQPPTVTAAAAEGQTRLWFHTKSATDDY